MKKLIVAAFLVVGLTTFAQVKKKENDKKEPIERMSPAERGEKALKRMTKDLGLNESQQKQMSTLLSEAQAKRENSENKPKKEDRQMMKDKINKILTPEQTATWEKLQAERKEKMKERKEEKREKTEDR